MLFKRSLSALMALSFTLGGCTDFLVGRKPEPEVIEFSDQKFICLREIPEQLKKFSVGEAQDGEVRKGFDCMSEALKYFNARTFGSLENAYTVDDLRKFFGKYFLKENNVSPEFAAELMKIKKAMLGGSTQSLSKDEIVQLVDILGVVRDEAVLVAPHMRVLLSLHDQKRASWDSITAATGQLRQSLRRLLLKTQIAKSDYSFDDAKKAVSGFAGFIQGGVPFAPYDIYSEWIPVVEAVKNVLMGQQAQFANLQEWSESLDTLMDLYELALKYHYVLRDLSFENAAKLRQGSQFINQGLQLLSNSHQMKTTGKIPLEDIDNLIDQVLPLVSSGIKTKSLKKTYRAVLFRMLDPDRKSDSRALFGLEKKHLLSFLREFNIWRLQQSFIDNLPFENHPKGLSKRDLVLAFNSFNRSFVIEKGLSDDPFEQVALEKSWLDFAALLNSPYPVVFNSEGRMMISSGLDQMGQTWASLTKANLMRSLSRLLTIGYGDMTSDRLSQVSLNKTGLISWYDDFQEIGLDLKAFDPRSANSGARSFLEANFFTFNGNGNELMEHRETYEFVSTLIAAGLSSSDTIRLHMVKAGCAVKDKDIFGNPYLNGVCYKNELKKNFATFFNNLPGMVQYVNSLSGGQWDQFYRYLADSSMAINQKVGFVETANIRSLTTILHYIETIIVVYDKNRNQKLSLEEVYAATPRFLPFFKTIANTDSETILEQGFAYLVFRGSIPTATDIAKFQWDKLWGVEDATRMEIVRLFGTLKDQLNKAKN